MTIFDISVIIPFLNEEENIDRLTTELGKYFSFNNSRKVEVIFVDDGSTDKSFAKLSAATHKGYTARVVKFSKNFGSHAALRAGILHAKGKYVTFMYADLQDPLELIDRLYTEITTGEREVVWAVRETVSSGLGERMFSGAYAYMMQRFAIKTYPEKGFDIVMFGSKVKALLNQNIEANSSIFLQILIMGFRQSSIQYSKAARKAGKSKWTLNKKIKLFIDSFVAFSFFPIRLVSIVGVSFFSLGLLWSLYIIGRKIIFNDLEPGWPALVSILMIGFGITNIALGIIAEYLWRTLDASRKRPVFIIDEIVEEMPHQG
ncbi:MAG TPA: glycosyltransferase [Cytophagaceae bacterium]|nr:glycosyltransferase [Cytophagaceae bacterium]